MGLIHRIRPYIAVPPFMRVLYAMFDFDWVSRR
jgi:hypothetical protein